MYEFNIASFTALDLGFYYTALIATIFFLTQMIMSFVIGGEHDFFGNSDHDFGSHDASSSDIAFQFLTIKNIIGFAVGFGWGGLAFHIEAGFTPELSIILATLVGLSIMLLQTCVLYLLHKLNAPNTQDTIEAAIGLVGRVYNIIPENNTGKVSLELNGKTDVLDAISQNGEEIPTGTAVKIVHVSGRQLVVRPEVLTKTDIEDVA